MNNVNASQHRKHFFMIFLLALTLYFLGGCAATTTESTPTSEPGDIGSENSNVDESTPVPAVDDETETSESTEVPDARSTRVTPEATKELEERVPPSEETPIVGEAPDELLTAVMEDLASRKDVQRNEISVIQAEFIIWNDGSLGCPQPGQVYTQALVEGYKIVLEANGETYDYHANDRGFFMLCKNSSLPPVTSGTPTS